LRLDVEESLKKKDKKSHDTKWIFKINAVGNCPTSRQQSLDSQYTRTLLIKHNVFTGIKKGYENKKRGKRLQIILLFFFKKTWKKEK
jgi:hypothetical protein